MARQYETAKEELTNTREELAAIEKMSEAEACKLYNVERKAEIVAMLNEEVESLAKEVEYLAPEVYEYEFEY
ncbi:MAG: hypothetical protein LIP00_05140 [Parabacteroides sp.]|nr:hypothetical protein [Parabacteroides sp.]